MGSYKEPFEKNISEVVSKLASISSTIEDCLQTMRVLEYDSDYSANKLLICRLIERLEKFDYSEIDNFGQPDGVSIITSLLQTLDKSEIDWRDKLNKELDEEDFSDDFKKEEIDKFLKSNNLTQDDYEGEY